MRQQLFPGVRYLDFKAVAARPVAKAADREYACAGVGIGLLNTLPVFEHAAGCAGHGRSDRTARDIGRVPVLDFVAADNLGERAPRPLLPGPADDLTIGCSIIERDNERTPATLALDGEERAFFGVDVGDAVGREFAIAWHALIVEPARRFGDA